MDKPGLEARIAELEERVGRLSALARETADVREIQEVQYRYLNALMLMEWDECAECFAEDAQVDVYLHEPVRGKENIRRWLKEELSQTHAGNEGDVCVNPIITVEGDNAKGDFMLFMMYFYKRTGQSMFWVQGRYDNDFVRENGRWKIACMRWSEIHGLPGGGPPSGLW
ncbi:MAG: nuclear transport factor 2 family protein [Actinobacteria bacterium]|jgi:ketosteroid isomerase-like protein|nr:nuclear transport factor 2 family protein [Actinomycetota bacterium]